MALQLGDTAPDFSADTTEGRINFHDWLGDSWAVLFSHPRNFTPVCTTELGYMASIKPEFDKRGVKIIGLSVDPVANHEQWSKDIEETQGTAPNYPLIGDSDFNVSKLYGMLPNDVSGDPTSRTPADNQTVRNVFVIGPDKRIKLIMVYPMSTGRNFDEVLRTIDRLPRPAAHGRQRRCPSRRTRTGGAGGRAAARRPRDRRAPRRDPRPPGRSRALAARRAGGATAAQRQGPRGGPRLRRGAQDDRRAGRQDPDQPVQPGL